MKLRNYLGKRLMKTEYVRRGLSSLLCICMILSMAPFIASEVRAETESGGREAQPEGAVAPEEIENLDQALHFLVRHWHTEEDSNAKYQGGSLVQSGDRYFVIAEGYIVPVYGEPQKSEDDESKNTDSRESEDPQQSEELREPEEPGHEDDGQSGDEDVEQPKDANNEFQDGGDVRLQNNGFEAAMLNNELQNPQGGEPQAGESQESQGPEIGEPQQFQGPETDGPLESAEPEGEDDDPSAVSYHALQDDRTLIRFDFYVRFQNSDWLYKMEPGRFESDYLESLDPVNGVLILKANPVKDADGGGYSETFSGFSVSAGRGAVSYGSSNGNSTLIITYDKYVHLVRANAFYVGLTVNGTSDSAVFGTTGIAGGEQDTVFLYVYQEAGGESGKIIDGEKVVIPAHKANEIVKLTVNGAEKVYQKGDALPEGLENLVKPEPVKFYSTVEGLHTDKTAYDVAGDGRTFDVELESWYTEGYAPQVGMVLDASGSMVFASDIPEPIRLTAEEIAEYGVKQLTLSDGQPVNWDDYFLNNNPNFNKILNPRYTDNTSLGATSYNYFVYDGTDYSPLGYWEGVEAEAGNALTAPTIAKTRNGTILGSVNRPNSDATQAAEFTHTQAGWYFITHAGQYENHYKAIGTGKRLIGLNGTQTSKDSGGKAVKGIVGLKDEVKLPAGGLSGGDQPKDTGYTYTNQTTDTPTLFYVDADGYLRCFYSGGSNLAAACSYVYFLDDSQNVRISAMQRALGLFVTELRDRSPSSRVSAVRFSTNDKTIDNKLDELVVLDWTNDPTVSSGMMGLAYGDGSADAFETNVGGTVKQYNYGITGKTSTATGIRAYMENLQANDQTHEKQPKYLIIFSDGQDTDVNFGSITGDHTSSQYENAVKKLVQESEAYKLVDQLKAEDYTVYTILLYGDDTSREYTNAHIFLRELAGTSNTTGADDKERYFYSVPKAREKAGSASAALDDSDVLTQIFVDDVLSQITNDLDEYRIRDYIDPRFDLIGSVAERYGSAADTGNSGPAATDGSIVTEEPGEPVELDATTSATRVVPATDTYLFRLKNNGVVILEGLDQETGKETGVKYAEFNLLTGDCKPKSGDADYNDYEPVLGSDGERLDLRSMLGDGNSGNRYLVIHSDKGGGGAAKNFCLCYDPANAMYYLEWKGETIPGSTFDAEQLTVWHATFTLRAKEDFVGGNAVLTNGQLAGMNYMFPKDGEAEASSGADKATGENPSKGFPRVTVNVKIPTSIIQGFEWTLWLGEDVKPEQLIQDLAETATESNFWTEYPRRFALAGPEMQETLYDAADIPLEQRQVYGDKEAIIKALFEDGGTIEIPYAFLPENPSTQAGNKLAQQIDALGVLSYSWERIDPDTGRVIEDTDNEDRYETGTGPLRSDSYMICDIRKVMYRLAVEYKPFPDPDGKAKTLIANTEILENIKNGYVTQMMAALTELENLLAGENLTRETLNEPLEKFETALESLRIDLLSLEFDSAVWGSEYEILAGLRDKLESLNVENNNERSEARAKAEECEEQLEYFDHLAEYALWCEEGHRTEARTKQNDTLIKDKDYSTPKPAVGSPQYNVTLAGEHTTRIVRGELAFELALNLDELEYMFDNDWNAKAGTGVTYTVKVEAKDVADDWETVIPTELNVTITKADLDALKALAAADKVEEANTVTLYYEDSKYPKAAYDVESGEVTFYTDPRIFNECGGNGYAHLLPRGTYTLTPDDDKNGDWEKFNLDLFTYAPLEDYTKDKGHFTDNPADYDDVNSLYSVYAPEIEEVVDAVTGATRPNLNSHYYAKTSEEDLETDSVTFLLGTYPYDPVPDISKVEDDATMSDLRYLTERVGMAKASATLENGLPDTPPGPSESPRTDPTTPTPTPTPSGDPTPAPSGDPTPAPSGDPTPTPSGEPTPSDDSTTKPGSADGLPEPSAPPDDPDESGLPQTGQLWWPVPLLFVGGLALFSAGMLLMRPKHKAGEFDEDGADGE